ncbi:unnamed protein product [Ectocarpus fasciculatus]
MASQSSSNPNQLLPFEQAWKRSGQAYFDQFPQENGSIFLFNTYTGEAIYDVDRWGSPLPGARQLSHWFVPTAVVPPATEGEPVNIHNLRDLRDDFPGSEYRARWHCAELIQRNVRAALSRWRVARALCAAWVKDYDHEAERFSFTHQITGEMQYHKPWGMGTVDLWAVPGENVDEHLVGLFLRAESATAEEHTDEEPRDWEASKRHRRRLYRFYREKKFSEGPHCRIVGPGSLKESSFTNVFLYPKKYYKTKPFSHPRDRQCEGARMGSQVTCMDGLVEKRISADAYFHVRNASEHGALNVIKLMFKHRDDLRVQGVGLQRMAGSLLEEDEAGGATEGQKKYLEKAFQLLRETPNVEWIQAEACAALASMTSGLCIRKEIDREHADWLEDVVTAIMGVKSITQTVKEIDPDGKETRYDVRVPSPMAHLVALHGCRILANMACDEHNRAEVARGSIGAVVHVAKLMADDPVLVCAVSAAVYNFVSRQETTHQIVVEAGTVEALEEMLKNLEYTDRKEKEMVTRALTALEPDGWRGVDHGLRDEASEVKTEMA